MPESYKVLGQVAPAANMLTDLYTVPVATKTVCSSIIVANQNAGAIAFRVSVAIAGAADTPAQYTHFDIALPGKSSYTGTLGLTLATTDVLRVRSDSANVSFNLFGAEVT